MTVFGLVLMMACTVFGITREWYCKLEKDKYQTCHKNIKGRATPPSECRCENMQLAKSDGSCKFLLLI